MRLNLVLLAAHMGTAEAQTTAEPELTTAYDPIFEVDFTGAEDAQSDQAPTRDVYRGEDVENKNNRRARLEIEKAHREREAAEAHQRPANGRMGGRMPFRGPFRGPPGPGGAGGRLGGFGLGGLNPSKPEPKPSEPAPPATTTTTTTTEAMATTAPSELFAQLKTTKKTITTTQKPTTAKPFWEKKVSNKNDNFGERSRSSFIDNITKYMEIAPRNKNSNRCLECKNAPNPAACLETRNVKQCTKNEACQTEIRWENGKTRIVSSCKQHNACRVMLSQNGPCNRLKGKKANRTCWKCCKGDLCNIADMAPQNFL